VKETTQLLLPVVAPLAFIFLQPPHDSHSPPLHSPATLLPPGEQVDEVAASWPLQWRVGPEEIEVAADIVPAAVRGVVCCVGFGLPVVLQPYH